MPEQHSHSPSRTQFDAGLADDDFKDIPDLEPAVNNVVQQSEHNHGHSHGHSHHCRHDHGEDGDSFTQTTKWIEATTALIVYSYVYGMMLDNCVGSEDKTGTFSPILSIGISWPSLTFGILLAAWAAWGSAESHQNLNAKNEDGPDHHECEDGHSHAHNELAPVIRRSGLSARQMGALIGDFIAHTGEVVAPITLVIDNVTQKYNLSAWQTRSWQGLTIGFSMIGSWANVRACKNSMLEVQHTEAESNIADAWTWIGLVAEAISLGLGNADWIATTITDCADLTKDVFEVSWAGFGVGVGVSALTVVASGYLHTLTNINYQSTSQPSKEDVRKTPLTTIHLAMQPLDYLTHIGAYTPRIDFFVERLSKGLTTNGIPLIGRIGVHAASLAVGSVAAFADWRACKNNAKKYNLISSRNRNLLFQPAENELTSLSAHHQNLSENLLTTAEQKENGELSRAPSPV